MPRALSATDRKRLNKLRIHMSFDKRHGMYDSKLRAERVKPFSERRTDIKKPVLSKLKLKPKSTQ